MKKGEKKLKQPESAGESKDPAAKDPTTNVTPLPGDKPLTPPVHGKNIVDPAKEWDMDEADMKEAAKAQQLDMGMGSYMIKLARMRRIYLVEEKRLMDKIIIVQQDLDNIMHNLKTKHKIIGDIKDLDLKRKKIIIQ